jgi:hypothetical protein
MSGFFFFKSFCAVSQVQGREAGWERVLFFFQLKFPQRNNLLFIYLLISIYIYGMGKKKYIYIYVCVTIYLYLCIFGGSWFLVKKTFYGIFIIIILVQLVLLGIKCREQQMCHIRVIHYIYVSCINRAGDKDIQCFVNITECTCTNIFGPGLSLEDKQLKQSRRMVNKGCMRLLLLQHRRLFYRKYFL